MNQQHAQLYELLSRAVECADWLISTDDNFDFEKSLKKLLEASEKFEKVTELSTAERQYIWDEVLDKDIFNACFNPRSHEEVFHASIEMGRALATKLGQHEIATLIDEASKAYIVPPQAMQKADNQAVKSDWKPATAKSTWNPPF